MSRVFQHPVVFVGGWEDFDDVTRWGCPSWKLRLRHRCVKKKNKDPKMWYEGRKRGERLDSNPVALGGSFDLGGVCWFGESLECGKGGREGGGVRGGGR